MEKYKFDESNGLWYERVGDYYLPCLTVPEEKLLGIWGIRHNRYLKETKRAFHEGLVLSGKLISYLSDVNYLAENMLSQLVEQMAKDEGVTEALKAKDQMEWVRRMNSIRVRATEIVDNELIYT